MTTPHKAMLIQAHDAPEPVAHIRQTYIVGPDGELLGVSEKKELRFGCGNDYAHCTPLYTHPPAVREPLSDAEIHEWWARDNGLEDVDMCKLADFTQVIRAIEAALRAKP